MNVINDNRVQEPGRHNQSPRANLSRWWRDWIWHPLLFSIYIVVALLANNIHEVEITDSMRAIFFSAGLAGLLMIIWRIFLRNWHRSGIVASLCILLIGLYGHVYLLLKQSGIVIGRHRYLLAFWLVILVLGILLVVRIRCPEKVTRGLNLISMLLLVFPMITILAVTVRSRTVDQDQPRSLRTESRLKWSSEEESPPDIYYIILDAYARQDVLQNRFGFDNSDFIDGLRARGFYIAQDSRSNYLTTKLSLSSSLNMDYLEEPEGLRSERDEKFTMLIRENEVRKQLEEIGYSMVSTTSSYPFTELTDADYYLIPNMANIEALHARGLFNDFESMLVHQSIAFALLDLNTLRNTSVSSFINTRLQNAKEMRREIVLAGFEHLERIPDIPEPTFAFIHIISPHHPYLFGLNGEEVEGGGPTTLVEEKVIPRTESWEGYRDQMLYINDRVLEALDLVIERSESDPIIIIQADHGPRTKLVWRDPQEPFITDRSGILNAYYLPEVCGDQLYDSISPVNSFRVVFNCVFNESLPRLDDQTFIDWESWTRIEFHSIEEFIP